MKSSNLKIGGVILAFISVIIIPIYTILTVVLYFLDIYGFVPLMPTLLKSLDWELFVLLGGSFPIYLLLANLMLTGYKKFRNPKADFKELFVQKFRDLLTLFRKLFKLL